MLLDYPIIAQSITIKFLIVANFCDYNGDFYKKLSLEPIFSLRKRIEAWRLTVLASVVPSDGDGDPVGH